MSCGIAQRTFVRWLEFGRAENAREPYRTFAQQVDRAFAEFIVSNVQAMDEGAKKDWRAALEMLKRRDPENFADPDRGATNVNVQVVVAAERAAAADQILAAAQRVLADDPERLEALMVELAGGQVVEGEVEAELEA